MRYATEYVSMQRSSSGKNTGQSYHDSRSLACELADLAMGMVQHGLLELVMLDLSQISHHQQQQRQRQGSASNIPRALALNPSVVHLLQLCVRHVANETSNAQIAHDKAQDDQNLTETSATVISGEWLLQVLQCMDKLRGLLLLASGGEGGARYCNTNSSNKIGTRKEDESCLWLPVTPADVAMKLHTKLRPLVLVGGATASGTVPSSGGANSTASIPPYLMYPLWGRMRRQWPLASVMSARPHLAGKRPLAPIAPGIPLSSLGDKLGGENMETNILDEENQKQLKAGLSAPMPPPGLSRSSGGVLPFWAGVRCLRLCHRLCDSLASQSSAGLVPRAYSVQVTSVISSKLA